jgi:hypothetical protein
VEVFSSVVVIYEVTNPLKPISGSLSGTTTDLCKAFLVVKLLASHILKCYFPFFPCLRQSSVEWNVTRTDFFEVESGGIKEPHDEIILYFARSHRSIDLLIAYHALRVLEQ